MKANYNYSLFILHYSLFIKYSKLVFVMPDVSALYKKFSKEASSTRRLKKKTVGVLVYVEDFLLINNDLMRCLFWKLKVH